MPCMRSDTTMRTGSNILLTVSPMEETAFRKPLNMA